MTFYLEDFRTPQCSSITYCFFETNLLFTNQFEEETLEAATIKLAISNLFPDVQSRASRW